jgi:D-aspartate ligase
MSSSGLALVRALGRRGVPVYAVDSSPTSVGMQSRYCTPLVCPDVATDEDAYIDFLVDLGKKLPEKGVLFPTGDRTVLAYSRHREALAPYFSWRMPPHSLIEQLVSKDGLDAIAREHGLPAPRTIVPRDIEELEALAGGLDYPVLIKPALSPGWDDSAIYAIIGDNNKVVVASSRDELLSMYKRLAPFEARMVVQELIPGPDQELFYVCMYCDASSEPVGLFAGQKLRLFPVHFGSASYVKTCWDPALVEVAVRTVKAVGYQGLCGVELKRDTRDGQYKLIEFNARFGLWDTLGAQVGVHLAHLAYEDAIGHGGQKSWSTQEGVSWLGLRRDFGAYRNYRREGTLSLPTWVRTVFGSDSYAVFSMDDPVPSLHVMLDFWGVAAPQAVRRRLGRLAGRVFRPQVRDRIRRRAPAIAR